MLLACLRLHPWSSMLSRSLVRWRSHWLLRRRFLLATEANPGHSAFGLGSVTPSRSVLRCAFALGASSLWDQLLEYISPCQSKSFGVCHYSCFLVMNSLGRTICLRLSADCLLFHFCAPIISSFEAIICPPPSHVRDHQLAAPADDHHHLGSEVRVVTSATEALSISFR